MSVTDTIIYKPKSQLPEIDFSSHREMAPYLHQPKAMYVGCPGKHGYLRMGFEIDSRGKCIMRDLDRRAPLIVQQELYFDEEMPDMPCVYILASGGPYVDGDRFEQDITMHKDSFAFISTGAATKIAQMKYNYSGMKQHFTLEENSYLEFLPEPVYPSRNSRFICDTEINIHPSATLLYSEIYTCGRKYYGEGEIFEFDILSVCTHAHRPDSEPLFREKFIIEPNTHKPKSLGIMHDYDIFANVLLLTPTDKADKVYASTEAFINADKSLAAGITRLPNDAGLIYKVLGKEPGPVKKMVRDFCSSVRMVVKGKPLPEEFPWR
jgi:urease accessory protein